MTLISDALRKSGAVLPDLPCEPVTESCALTGETCRCIPRKHVIGKSFTTIDILAMPDSQYIGEDVYTAWMYGYRTKPESKKDKRPECMASWFCDGETFREISRTEVRDMVFQENMPERWTAYATTSYKKHGSIVARVNTGRQRVWAFETRIADCSDMDKVRQWWSVLNTALRSGIGRTVLESLNCPPFLIGKVGMRTWMDFETWAKDRYLSALYSFLCYLLPSQEELKNESLHN